ncbi:hypothetical protein, partial [Azospirillum sp. B4]|uniref:hypothetical protein n=1 Tax=Azospirillum sp. B4 TaxID=95605 RepID=UPI0005CAD972
MSDGAVERAAEAQGASLRPLTTMRVARYQYAFGLSWYLAGSPVTLRQDARKTLGLMPSANVLVTRKVEQDKKAQFALGRGDKAATKGAISAADAVSKTILQAEHGRKTGILAVFPLSRDRDGGSPSNERYWCLRVMDSQITDDVVLEAQDVEKWIESRGRASQAGSQSIWAGFPTGAGIMAPKSWTSSVIDTWAKGAGLEAYLPANGAKLETLGTQVITGRSAFLIVVLLAMAAIQFGPKLFRKPPPPVAAPKVQPTTPWLDRPPARMQLALCRVMSELMRHEIGGWTRQNLTAAKR